MSTERSDVACVMVVVSRSVFGRDRAKVHDRGTAIDEVTHGDEIAIALILCSFDCLECSGRWAWSRPATLRSGAFSHD